jgi:hypothetical protein
MGNARRNRKFRHRLASRAPGQGVLALIERTRWPAHVVEGQEIATSNALANSNSRLAAVGALFAFGDPLQARGDGGAELGLVYAEEKTVLPQAHANMHVRGLRLAMAVPFHRQTPRDSLLVGNVTARATFLK